MSLKKERAGITAMLMLAHLILITFVIDAALVKGVSIAGVILPLAIREGVLLFILLAMSFAGYFVCPYTKRLRDRFAMAAFGLEGLFWILSVIWMGTHKVLGATEIVFAFLMVLLLGVCAFSHISLSPKKEKGNWFRVRLMISVCTLVMMAASYFVVFRYRNDFIRTDASLVMFSLCVVSLIFLWWFPENVNHILTLVLVVGQLLVFLICFGGLCKNKDMQSLVGVAFAKKSTSQMLMTFACLFVFLLAISILLHYLKNLQVVGKLASISLACLVVGSFLILRGMSAGANKTTNIDAGDAVSKEEYGIYVLKEDSAEKLSDVTSYVIGYASEGRTNAMNSALAALTEKLGVSPTLVRKDTFSELANALYDGEVKAVFFECLYAEMIDLGFEVAELDRTFTEDTRLIGTVEIDEVPDDENPQVPTPTIDPNATPTPTLAPGDPTPIPTREPGKTIPFTERPDNSGKDLSTTPFTVYISGIDTYGGISARSRSDVNLLIAINPKTKEMSIVTTPRDSYVDIPGKTSDLRDKLTHAGIYGPQYSMATLEYLYGVPVDFYVRVNFSSVIAIVDVLGGVDVQSLYSFTSIDGYSYAKGLNHLNGTLALGFARERKNVPGGDWTRGKHQIELIKGIIGKMTSSSVLTNYESLLNAVSKSFQTDVTLAQISQLVGMQMSDSAQWHITSYETTGHGDMRLCDVYRSERLWVAILDEPSVHKASELMTRVLNGDHIADGEYKYDN